MGLKTLKQTLMERLGMEPDLASLMIRCGVREDVLNRELRMAEHRKGSRVGVKSLLLKQAARKHVEAQTERFPELRTIVEENRALGDFPRRKKEVDL